MAIENSTLYLIYPSKTVIVFFSIIMLLYKRATMRTFPGVSMDMDGIHFIGIILINHPHNPGNLRIFDWDFPLSIIQRFWGTRMTMENLIYPYVYIYIPYTIVFNIPLISHEHPIKSHQNPKKNDPDHPFWKSPCFSFHRISLITEKLSSILKI